MDFEWPSYTVEELVAHGVLAAPLDGNHGGIHPKSSDFVSEGIPFIMASDLLNGAVDLQHCAFLSEIVAKKLRKGFAKTGDVLISHKATIGRTALVQDSVYKLIILTPQVTYYRVLNKAHLDNRYLKYYFDSAMFQHILGNWAGAGSTRAYIGITAQRKLPIVCPPIQIQKFITSILAPLDEQINLLRETNVTLESIAQTLFKSWFIDFDPVHAKAEGREPEGMDAETAALFPDSFVESELGLVPKGWVWTSFVDTVHIIGGGTPKTSMPEYWQGNIPWFSVIDAPAKSDVFVMDTEKHINELAVKSSSTKLLPEGTTIISARGTVGRLALVGKEMAMNQSCYGLQGKANDAYFTYFNTYRLVETLKQYGHGSVFNTITRDTFSRVSIVYPNLEIIGKFEETLFPVMERIKKNNEKIVTLVSMRDILLPRLISGQLRLAEISGA